MLVGLGLLLVLVGPRLPAAPGPRAQRLVARLPPVSAIVVVGLCAVMTTTAVLSVLT